MASTSVEKLWNISRYAKADDQTRGGSKLTSLTNPSNAGKIKYLTEEGLTVRSASDLTTNKRVTGIVFPIGAGTVAGGANDGETPWDQGATSSAVKSTGTPWWDVGAHLDVDKQLGNVAQNWGYNQIGDPAELSYKLTSDDFIDDVTIASPVEKDGSAQKFVNALLDSAYVAYNSGVNQGSGLNSMTVSRGALSLTSSSMSGISGITNTYSRSYSVTFNYTQSGIIEAGATAALPDITNDLITEANNGAGPF